MNPLEYGVHFLYRRYSQCLHRTNSARQFDESLELPTAAVYWSSQILGSPSVSISGASAICRPIRGSHANRSEIQLAILNFISRWTLTTSSDQLASYCGLRGDPTLWTTRYGYSFRIIGQFFWSIVHTTNVWPLNNIANVLYQCFDSFVC